MSNELITTTKSLPEIKVQINTIQKVLHGTMKDGTHYGVIPGCEKPSLWKPGAELILTTFHLGCDYDIDDLCTPDEVRYRVTAQGFYIPNGKKVGSGIGECSSNEKKYCWRKAICDEEFNETDEDKKQIAYSQYKGKIYKTKQIRTNPADIANTILKMAKKRAMVDFCLSATACSDIFTQDLDEPEAPENAPDAPSLDLITQKQQKRLFAIMSKAKKRTETDLKKYIKDKFGIESTMMISKSDYENICDWAEGKNES